MNSDGSTEKPTVEFSDDSGASWVPVELPGSTPGWLGATYRIGEHVPLSDGYRVRLNVADLGFSDVIEAGVDGFVIRDVSCPDLSCGPADIAEPFGVLDLSDLEAFVGAFVAGCPLSRSSPVIRGTNRIHTTRIHGSAGFSQFGLSEPD